MKKMIFCLFPFFLLMSCQEPIVEPTPGPGPGPGPTPTDVEFLDPIAADPMSWVALAPDGTWMDDYPEPQGDKTVGIFYFLWHGCHGYDTLENHNEVVEPDGTNTRSPYNNEILYNPADPKKSNFGPFSAFHHWGEPYLGYYIANDDWIFRKHAQMLTDAGVDVIYIDATNGFDYIENLKVLAREFEALREKGCKTPQFAYLLNTDQDQVFKRLLSEIYIPGRFKDLWFKWQNKPLLLAYGPALTPTRKTDFTLRYSWFCYGIPGYDDWYDNARGEDMWPWGSWYPQKPGYHGGDVEEAAVMAATHPLDNMGRSFDPVTKTEPAVKQTDKGIHFRTQFEKAVSYNPKHLFFTGWNEWMAMRQVPRDDINMLGMKSTDFGCYFVDHFNHEYSRDLEPVRGGFGDAYYYMLADMCRKFKGTPERPVYSKTFAIKLDGNAADWYDVDSAFGDDRGDATEHKHIGYGRVGMLTNNTARNDIELCKVATDGTNLYFYVQVSEKFKGYGTTDWMKLFIGVNPAEDSSWEGFNFAVQRVGSKTATVALEACTGGFAWEKVCDVPRHVADRIIELSVPLASLGITDPSKFSVDFKWIDNAAGGGDIQTCLSDGDSAPDGRFRYRYCFDSTK